MSKNLTFFVKKGYPFSMFVTKRWCFNFVTIFLSISSLFKISKIGSWTLFCKWKFLRKVEKGVALTSDYICLQKMKKGTLFINWLLQRQNGKGHPFLSILLSLKTIGKGVIFQNITPIRATFTNTIANIKMYFQMKSKLLLGICK